MTSLERKMSRTTEKLIGNLKKITGEVPVHEQAKLDKWIQALKTDCKENSGIDLKAKEHGHVE